MHRSFVSNPDVEGASRLSTYQEGGRWCAKFKIKGGAVYIARAPTEQAALEALRKMLADRARALRGDDDE
jgi:myo-inositol-1-phosphate synthase